MPFMATHCLGELLMPIVRDLSGKRQDGLFEVALPVFMDHKQFCCLSPLLPLLYRQQQHSPT